MTILIKNPKTWEQILLARLRGNSLSHTSVVIVIQWYDPYWWQFVNLINTLSKLNMYPSFYTGILILGIYPTNILQTCEMILPCSTVCNIKTVIKQKYFNVHQESSYIINYIPYGIYSETVNKHFRNKTPKLSKEVFLYVRKDLWHILSEENKVWNSV